MDPIDEFFSDVIERSQILSFLFEPPDATVLPDDAR